MVQLNLPVLHTVLYFFKCTWQDGLKFVVFFFFLFGEWMVNSSHMTVFSLDLPGEGLAQQGIKQRTEVKSSCAPVSDKTVTV